MELRAVAVGLCALALAGCASSQLRAEKPSVTRAAQTTPRLAATAPSGSTTASATRAGGGRGSAGGVLRPPVGPTRLPAAAIRAWELAYAREFVPLERAPDPVDSIGFRNTCQLLDIDIVSYCGGSSRFSPAFLIGAAKELEVTGPGWRAAPDGALTEAEGPPLLVGQTLTLHAINAVDGQLAVVSMPKPDALTFSRFPLSLPAGASATIRYLPGGVALEKHDAAPIAPAASASVTRPALPPFPAPNSASPYQNCAQVGRTENVNDHLHDVTSNPGRVPITSHEGVDITQVTIARAGSILCADITTHAPPAGSFSLTLDTLQQEPTVEIIRIWLTADGRRLVSVDPPPFNEPEALGYVDALVGIRRDTLSLMIDTSQLEPFPAAGPFSWEVEGSASVSLTTGAVDCAPDGPSPIYPPNTSTSYPPGRACLGET